MRTKLKLMPAAAMIAAAFSSAPSYASHVTIFAPIDSINFTFGAGGGTQAVTTSGGSDDAWLRFAANAGDVLSITGAGIFGPNVVLFKAGTNGIVEVGDIYTATGVFDGEVLQIGTGVDLIVQDMNFRSCGDCYVSPGSDTFSVTSSGEYVIGISAANEDDRFSGTTTITLLGNTASIGASVVPEPTSLALLALGLAGLFRFTRRKAA